MKLGPVVLKIRLAETMFGNRVSGAAELEAALEDAAPEEAAYVIQRGESASGNEHETAVVQTITEVIGVAVCLRNDTSQKDKTGLTAFDRLEQVRSELFRALLGWVAPGAESMMEYAGGELLGADRAYLWYLFEFSAETRIDLEEMGIDNGYGDLGSFDRVYAEYLLAPSEELPVEPVGGDLTALTVGASRRNAAQQVSLDVDLHAGAYSRAWREVDFDVYTGG